MILPATQPDSWLFKLVVSFFLATTVGIILYTMYAAFYYSSNAVLGRDEANFIILSSEKILSATSTMDFIRHLFPSHGQHVLFGMQLVNLLTYFSFGALDRRVMNVIGVAVLCVAGLVLSCVGRNTRTEKILVCATLLPLILSPAHSSCIVNASCTGNHYLGVAFSVFSLYFFTKRSENSYRLVYFIGAELFILLAVFSLSTALALIPVSFFILATTPDKHRPYWIIAHATLMLAALVLQYYITYPDTIFSFAQNPSPGTLYESAKAALLFCATFFIILGSMIYWLNDGFQGLAVVGLGAITLSLILFAILKFRPSTREVQSSFHICSVILFLVMILLICVGRYYSLGSSRYAVYTAFLSASLWLVFFDRISPTSLSSGAASKPKVKVMVLSSALSLTYYAMALHYNYPYLEFMKERSDLCRNLWRTEARACGIMLKHEEATRIIQSAIDRGIYRVEQ